MFRLKFVVVENEVWTVRDNSGIKLINTAHDDWSSDIGALKVDFRVVCCINALQLTIYRLGRSSSSLKPEQVSPSIMFI